MNLQHLADIISPRLPLELVWLILSHLPVQDIIRLVQDDCIDRLLIAHPFFNERHIHVLLTVDPTAFQAYLVPGRPLPNLTYAEPCGQFYSIAQPLSLASFHYTKHRIEFHNHDQDKWVRIHPPASSATTTTNGVAGVMGMAVVLVHNNVIIKRSLHAVNPARTPWFERSQGYFGGGVQFEYNKDKGGARVVSCTANMDWFCS